MRTIVRMPPRSCAVALLLIGATGCNDWREQADPTLVADPPVQQNLQEQDPIRVEFEGHRVELTPRAAYSIRGYAAEISRELLDEWDFVIPIDVGIIWGELTEPDFLKYTKFHLSKRYFSFRYNPPRGGKPMPRNVGQYMMNNHLIPATEEIRETLDDLKIGDLVTLEGKLVDVVIRDPTGHVLMKSKTSLTRDDVGNGACEQLWVESITVERAP